MKIDHGNFDELSWRTARRIDQLCDEFERRLKADEQPCIDSFLEQVAETAKAELLRYLIELEVDYRICEKHEPTLEEYSVRFPEQSSFLESLFAQLGPASNQPPHDDSRREGNSNIPLDTVEFSTGGEESTNDLPARFGRYKVKGRCGKGAFKVVYLAHDDKLHRDVAIAVLHRDHLADDETVEKFLSEARILARLDHPGVVPVHDVGKTEDGVYYLVERFVRGDSLETLIEKRQFAHSESANLVAKIARALNYVHEHRLVHRDIKPDNVMLEADDSPVLTDFGLALRDEDFGKRPELVGTYPYMSPEVVRIEGHLVDGRSDIYSLGVIFYRLLTGELPFKSRNVAVLTKLILYMDPTPPRLLDESIPKELEFVCLKALSKRPSDRYDSASDMAADLRHYLSARSATIDAPSVSSSDRSKARECENVLRIIPRGLRPFESEDASFFLGLLPGPRDRDEFPESILFWKTRVEEIDAEQTFRVGLIYGPSGCGKSSFVRAGLLPHLQGKARVTSVFVEASAEGTEDRLLASLRRSCPSLPGDLGLTETLHVVRLGGAVPVGRKILLVIDQFEQWLHARESSPSEELVQALRQCDGSRLQCILLVRDDFWMAVSRFMKELEVRLQEGHNSAAVDLFDLRHAQRVLGAFGTAYGALADSPERWTREQKNFLARAVTDLAQNGKVAPIRLSLFAGVLRGKVWSSGTWKEVGGAEGVGVKFLDETFSATTSPPENRCHERAARNVLESLLPDRGTNIKGHSRSRQELLLVSGYEKRPADFADLIRILDNDVRILTPLDRGSEGDDATDTSYQLTHDYLVESLREWLTSKQKSTMRGRAEILLEQRIALWKAKPEARQLPSFREWLKIRLLTKKCKRSESENQLIKVAGKRHLLRCSLLVICVAFVGWGIFEFRGGMASQVLRIRLLNADSSTVPGIIEEIRPYGRWVYPMLRRDLESAPRLDNQTRLRATLALLPVDRQSQGLFLREQLLAANPQDFALLRNVILNYGDPDRDELWKVMANANARRETRFRAGCALISFDRDSSRWSDRIENFVELIVSAKSFQMGQWVEILRDFKHRLIGPLTTEFHSGSGNDARYNSALLLAEFLDDADDIVWLIRTANPDQHDVLVKKLEMLRKTALPSLASALSPPPLPATSMSDALDHRASTRANVALAMLALGHHEEIWPLFHGRNDPRVSTVLIHKLAEFGANPAILLNKLEARLDCDPAIRRALILSLGEYGEKLSETVLERAIPWLLDTYRFHLDSEVHSAAEWALHALGEEDEAARIHGELQSLGKQPHSEWWVDVEGHTMIVVQGSGDDQYALALSSREVSVEQYLRFKPDHRFSLNSSPEPDCPVNSATLEEAQAYCRWLSQRESLSGEQSYRLINRAEWDQICEAGGECPVLDYVGEYSWYEENSSNRTWPVGTLKPDNLGLFDKFGNLQEWCLDPFSRGTILFQLWAGGCFSTIRSALRCSNRTPTDSTMRNYAGGFRVARFVPRI